jgi:Amt family ammonium transporter
MMPSLKRMKRFIGLTILVLIFISGFTFAEEQVQINPPVHSATEQAVPAPPKIDTGDTAWMIVATAFVMLMTLPGLALFYGGLAKRKDTLNTMAMSFVTYCIVSFLWIIYGFSFAFGTDVAGIIGSTEKILLSGVWS